MTIEEILSIGIVGAGISLLIQFIKNKFGANENVVKLVTLVFCLVSGSIYYFLSDTAFFTAVLGILGAATVIWSYMLKGSTLFVPKSKAVASKK